MNSPAQNARWRGLIHEYRAHLPLRPDTEPVTLCEGNTPLIECPRVSARVGHDVRVFVKYEGLNPTGSFKDRGMTMAVTKAKEDGSRAVICASTGNTSASAAAYAARAGMACAVLIPSGKNVAMGKLAQAAMHGAKVVRIEGNFDQALEMVRVISDSHPITLVNSVNPYRIEGQKTASFEICRQLGGPAPDIQVMPVGNAGNITAYWNGYREWRSHGHIDTLPTMWGFQAAGSAPIVLGHRVMEPETIATAIKIGNPASWRHALCARDGSRGIIDMVTDEEITEAYRYLADQEGVFCEPASAASVAGLFKAAAAGLVARAADARREPLTIVCILTGHGLKDPDYAIHCSPAPTVVPASQDAVLEVLGLR